MWRRRRQLRPRPAGTRVRCTAQTCRILNLTHAPRTGTRKMVLDVDSTSRDAARAGNVMRFTLYGTAAPDANSPVRSSPLTHATKSALSRWKVSWTDYASRYDTRRRFREIDLNTRGTPERCSARANQQPCTTLFADRNQRLDVMLPNALHTAVSYRMCSREPR